MEIALFAILIGLILVYFVITFARRKKYNEDLGTMRADLKKGDKVMTDTGMIGFVEESYEEEGYKYFVLKSGHGANVGYFTVHANSIYYVFGKDQKPATAEAKKEVKVEEVKEEKVAESTETPAEVKQTKPATKSNKAKGKKSSKK
ncbi:MAG: preprotein translocase subunit YajC [Clostridia bacterium]|nr:preprotein translocase subunit YajC [Clostridia bacterium]